jgi:hypothetical protein
MGKISEGEFRSSTICKFWQENSKRRKAAEVS